MLSNDVWHVLKISEVCFDFAMIMPAYQSLISKSQKMVFNDIWHAYVEKMSM